MDEVSSLTHSWMNGMLLFYKQGSPINIALVANGVCSCKKSTNWGLPCGHMLVWNLLTVGNYFEALTINCRWTPTPESSPAAVQSTAISSITTTTTSTVPSLVQPNDIFNYPSPPILQQNGRGAILSNKFALS